MVAEPPREDEIDLTGKRVLLIEDEYFIADEMVRALKSAGAIVLGPLGTLASARAALDEGQFDCAVLDLNLHGESAISIADRLVAEDRSFAIATGYGITSVPDRFRSVPRIEKPFDPSSLMKLVARL